MSGGKLVDPAEEAKHIHVPTYDEILERIGRRFSAKKGKMRPWEREIARLQTVRDIVISKTDFIRSLVRLLDNLHPFYWSLIEVEFERARIRKSISCISRARKLTDELFEKYRFHLMAAEDRRELERVAREARGRILSLYKRCSRDLDLLRSLVVFIQHLPGIDPELPTVIVAGPPSSGKSSFVRSVSRAKPKVAEYPFTTKTVHIGHVNLGGEDVVQVIDTPGILDRPVDEMNIVERRAAAALRHLPGVVLFLVDPTEKAYMPLERQVKLLEETVKKLVSGKPVYVAINKADAASRDRLEEARRAVESLHGVKLAGSMSAIERSDAIRILRIVVEDSGILSK